MAALAAVIAERARLMNGGRSLTAIVVPDATVGVALEVKDSRNTPQNEAQVTDSFSPSSWNRYDVGSAATYPDSEVTFS